MATLYLDTFRNIKTKFESAAYSNSVNRYLAPMEQKTGLKREQAFVGLLCIVIIYLMFGFHREVVCNFVGFVYPSYSSLMLVESKAKIKQNHWLMYWIVYTSFILIEFLVHRWVHHLFGYWLLKCILLIYLMLSEQSNGNHVIYRIITYLLPIFRKQNAKTIAYNPSAGRSDIVGADLYDQHGNPIGKNYDLGRDGSFTEYSILIGQFYTDLEFDVAIQKPIDALKVKGFQIKHVKNEIEFLQELRSNGHQIAWVISTSRTANDTLVSALLEFHSSGGAIFLFADNVPYISPASEFLNKKFGITLIGDFLGTKTLNYEQNGYQKAGYFGQHHIFTGIKHLFEGCTICHPVYSNPESKAKFVTVATATDGSPCISVYDPILKSSEGRLCLDCGFTKLFMNWDDAGTARYIVNVSCWLAGVDRI